MFWKDPTSIKAQVALCREDGIGRKQLVGPSENIKGKEGLGRNL